MGITLTRGRAVGMALCNYDMRCLTLSEMADAYVPRVYRGSRSSHKTDRRGGYGDVPEEKTVGKRQGCQR